MTSLKHFYRFTLSDSLSLSPNTVKQIHATTDRVALWITSYRKDSARHKLEKMYSDIKLPKKADVAGVLDNVLFFWFFDSY